MDRNPEDKNIKEIFKSVKEALTISYKAAPKTTIALVSAQVIDGLIPVVQILINKQILDNLALVIQNKSINVDNILYLLLSAFLVQVFSNALTTVDFFATSRLFDELARYTQISIMKQSLKLDIKHFEDSEFYNQFEKARRRIDSALPGVVMDSTRLITQIVTFVSVSIVLIKINWLLLPLIILVNIPVLVWGMGYSLVTHNLGSSRIPEARKADYLSRLASDERSIKEVKLFNLGNYLINKYERFLEKVINENWAVSKKQFSGAFFVSLISDAVYYGFYVWVVMRTVVGRLTIGDVAMYIQAFNRTSGALKNMLRYINNIYRQGLYIHDFQEFMKATPELTEKENAKSLEKINTIKFENVSFRYKEDKPYVLQNVSFEINTNENVALVGQNGAGKTTIVKLMMRLYDVTGGRILINDVDVREYKIEDLWRQIGTVFQDFVRYHVSAKENIAFGQIEKINNIEEIKKAAHKSGASEFIESFDKQYEKTLGTRFEDGVDLSGGQWQKIALSRAFIRDCSVLILDEPTASIDAKAEYEIFKRFIELVEGKITLLISHRFSTVRLADKIIVIEEGKVIETGSHKELLDLNGRYAELFNLQAEGYK